MPPRNCSKSISPRTMLHLSPNGRQPCTASTERKPRSKASRPSANAPFIENVAPDGKLLQVTPSAPSTTGSGRARRDRIERALSRDPVGESTHAQASLKCPGSGQELDLDVHRFTQSAVVHVQCRECGSIRKGLLKKDHVVCRDHEKLRGRSTHTGPRWVKHPEAGWKVEASAKT